MEMSGQLHAPGISPGTQSV